MEEELKVFCILDGRLYCLFLLFMVSVVYDEEYYCLLVIYVNFLIMNEVVFYFIYVDFVNDMCVKEVLVEVFFGREIVGIDCIVLIK